MPIEYNDLSADLKNRVRTALVNKGKTLYVHATGGNDASSGRSWNTAYLTMSKAFDNLSSGDTIVFAGKIKEQLVTPALVFDVSVVGAGNRPRHADDSPTPVGGKSAATWTFPDSAAANTALVRVQQQGWRFENILFASQTAVAANNAAIQLYRTVEDANERDASHLSVIGCRFASGYKGIDDIGGCAGVLLQDNFFAAVTIAVFGVGNIGVGQTQWVIKGNRFIGMDNGIKIGANDSLVTDNVFSDGLTPNTTYVLNLASGAGVGGNFVHDNFFQGSTANFNTPDLLGSATDVWMRNYAIDSTSAGVGGNFEAGQPA